MADMTARLASFFCLLVAVPAAANVAASTRTPAAFTLSPGRAYALGGDGEGTSGALLATSPAVSMGSQTAGTPSGYYAFSFASPGLILQPNHAYTFRLVRLSQYSGAYSMCADMYSNGIQYWLGTYADPSYDVAFRLYGLENPIEALAWQASGPGTRTSTADTGAADAMTFSYFLNGSSVWNTQTWTFSALSPQTRVFTFDWNYSGYHAFFMVYAHARAFADGPNGRTYVELYTRTNGDGWNVSGLASLQLYAGYSFGIILDGRNYDSDARLIGNFTLTTHP
jgi:hypothetical protein